VAAAAAPMREPERCLVVQTVLLEPGDGVAQVRFQLARVVGREIGLRGEFRAPVLNGDVQIEMGLIFHYFSSAFWSISVLSW